MNRFFILFPEDVGVANGEKDILRRNLSGQGTGSPKVVVVLNTLFYTDLSTFYTDLSLFSVFLFYV